jgi:xanthine/CO dehydrogenase XdhC/CoxF family maturation factor
MTHELKKIFQVYESTAKTSLKAVLATVVALEGSSYRKPGVRMLILENGSMVGAVSGGCVEKEVLRQAESVFKSGEARVMTYDGRYRLGCEGILYILLEPFDPQSAAIKRFWENVKERNVFTIESYYEQKDIVNSNFGSCLIFGEDQFSFQGAPKSDPAFSVFSQSMDPGIQLFIVGAEHDAVQLSALASGIGMEVIIVANPTEEKSSDHFPGSERLLAITPEVFPTNEIDEQTAIVLMNHSYAKDLQYLITLKARNPFYLGLLGPYKRREDLLNAFLEQCPETEDTFLECIHGPAGLDIGAVTPQEIAIAILAEILMVARNRIPVKLRDKKGSIHNTAQ